MIKEEWKTYDIWKALYQKKWSPYLFMVLTYLPIILFVWHFIGDDVFFEQQLEQISLWEYLIQRYETWTSRVLIEAVMLPMYHVGIGGWKIINFFFYVLLFWGTVTLFTNKTPREIWMMSVLFLLIPVDIYRGCGWIAVSLNYIWPFACALIAMFPLRKIWDGCKVGIWQWLISCFCLIFAGNQEQILAFLLMIYVLVVPMLLWKKRKISAGIFIHILILSASFMWFVTCPGNAARMEVEMQTRLPEFDHYSVMDKFSIGFLDTFVYYVGAYRFQFVFFNLCVVLSIVYWNKCKHLCEKITLIMLVILAVIIGYLGNGLNYLGKLPQAFRFLYNNRVLEESGGPTALFVLEIVVYLFVILGILWFLFHYPLAKGIGQCWYLACVLGVGFVSRCMIGFSPSIYDSGARISLLCTFCLIVVMGRLLLEEKSLSKYSRMTIGGMVILSALRNLAFLVVSSN